MSFFANYLFENVTITLFICLGFGYLLGKAKIKNFSLGYTAGTLIIGFAVGLFINYFSTEKLLGMSAGTQLVSGPLSSMFFTLFCFTIGFEVGPSFFSSLKTTGLRVVSLAIIFDVLVFVTAVIICKIFGFSEGTGIGLISGAITQSSVLGTATNDIAADATVAYALTYIFGTIGVIFFIRKLAPLLLREDLFNIAKNRINKDSSLSKVSDESTPKYMIQMRAYEILPNSIYCNKTVFEVEDELSDKIEIEAVYRGDDFINECEDFILQENDVIQVVGSLQSLDLFDDLGLKEVSECTAKLNL